MNSRDVRDLADRMLMVDYMTWNDTGAMFTEAQKNYLKFPEAIFYQNESTPVSEASNTVLRTLTKWRYLKANFNLRVAFNTNQYTQGKLIMYFLPLGNLQEIENMTLTRAQQLRHVIIDANSDRDFVEFTIPYQNVYGAMDLVEGTGDIGYIGLLPLNKLRNAGSISLNGKVFVSLDTKELSYNNSIGKVNIPNNFENNNLRPNLVQTHTNTLFANAVGEADRSSAKSGGSSSKPKSQAKKGSPKPDPKKETKTSENKKTAPKSSTSKHPAKGKKGGGIKPVSSVKNTTKGQPDLYENFPQRDYTHIDRSKDQPTLLAIAAQETSKASTSGYDDDRREMSLCEMAKQHGYLCTFNLSINDNIRDPIFTLPVMPGLINPEQINPNGGSMQYSPTTLAMATSISNFWKGDINFKFTMTKTPTHSGRLRIVYIPFSSLGQFQPLMTNKAFENTVNAYNNLDKGNFTLDLMPNVENYVWEFTDQPNFEISIPFNSIYPKLTSCLSDIYGLNVSNPTDPYSVSVSGTNSFAKILNLNTCLGQILFIPETGLVTSQLTAQNVDINVYISSPNLELFYFNNNKVTWADVANQGLNSRGEASYSKGGANQEDANSNQIEQEVLTHASDDVPIIPMMKTEEKSFPQTLGLKMDDISSLIKRPGWNNFGPGTSGGYMGMNLDPSNFQQYKDDTTPINWFSYMYRLYQGEKNYMVKLPKISQDSASSNITEVNLNPNINVDFNFQGEVTKLYQTVNGTQTIDPGSFSLLLDKDIMDQKAAGTYSDLYKYLTSIKYYDTAAWQMWINYLRDVFTSVDIESTDDLALMASTTLGEVGNLSNKPGSVFYHSEPIEPTTIESLENTLGYDNNTLIPAYAFSPVEDHSHTDILDDGSWWEMKRGIEPFFLPNTEATFYFSSDHQLNSPLIGTYFRDGPVGSIYYRIVDVNPYDMIISMEPMFDRGAPYTESPLDTLEKITTGQYEVWSGTDFNDFPREPVQRDVKFGRIVDVTYDSDETKYYNGFYTINLYEEDDTDILINTITMTFDEFYAALGDTITNFNGVVPDGVFPPKGKMYRTPEGMYVHENGKRYKIPADYLMYFKYSVLPIHEHGTFPPHSHDDDGYITMFGLKLDSHCPTFKELADFLYKYYSWLTAPSNLHRKGLPRNTFAYMLMFIKEYELDPTVFYQRFYEHRIFGKRLFATFTEMDEAMLTSAPFSSEIEAFHNDQVSFDQFELYKARTPGSSTYYAQAVPVPVVHVTYGSESNHVHNIRSEFAMQWTSAYSGGSIVPVFTPQTPVTSIVSSVDYTYNEMVKVISGMQSAVSYVVDHAATEQNADLNSFMLEDGSLGIFKFITGAIGAVGSLFRTIRGKKNKNVPSLIQGGFGLMGDMTNTKAIVAGTKDTTKAIIENAFNIHDFFEAFRENFIENVVPALQDMVKDQAINLVNALDIFGKEFVDVDKVTTEPFYPTSILTAVNQVTAKLEGVKPETPLALKLGATTTPSSQEEDMTAMLSPILKTGEISSYSDPADFQIPSSAGYTQSYPTTSVCPIYNNFITFRIPYYNNSVAQKIGKPGDAPIKNTGRACAAVSLNSAAIKGKSNITLVTSSGYVATPFDYPRKRVIPTYGYFSPDINDSVSAELKVYNSTGYSLSPSSGVKLGIWAADNFSYGEFIGIPPMKATFTPMWNTVAYGEPKSIL